MQPPSQLGDARIICYTPIDDRHAATGACRHIIGGEAMRPINAMAVCQYSNNAGFYLFYCDSDWNMMTDTYHDTFVDALAQAEFEYLGVATTWKYFKS